MKSIILFASLLVGSFAGPHIPTKPDEVLPSTSDPVTDQPERRLAYDICIAFCCKPGHPDFDDIRVDDFVGKFEIINCHLVSVAQPLALASCCKEQCDMHGGY